jgi:hypothetical protein
MIASELAATFLDLFAGSDMAKLERDDLVQRFESLRSSGKLPRGRERRDQQLSNREISAAILGLVSPNPKWAGHTASVLCNLRTVGGESASFRGTRTLQEAVELVLADPSARNSVVGLTVTGAASGTNSHGSAIFVCEVNGERHRVFYVPQEAVSQLQPGMQQRFDADLRNSPISRELSFNSRFFDRIAKAVELAKLRPALAPSDASGYEVEEARAARFQKLGARPGSRFLNIGVENQVTWPKEERLVQFDQYRLVLMPKTEKTCPSIHVDLTANGLAAREAMTVVNRFLSIMTWCDDQFSIAQDGWSGNPVPVAVPRRDLAFTTAHNWLFHRKLPPTEDVKRALAIYREARNAQQNYMVSYAVLNYYKIVEIRFKGRGPAKNWFRDNFAILREQSAFRSEFEEFAKQCDGEQPHEYIYKACRVAVAHADTDSRSDPDDANELVRLHRVANVLRILARHFIAAEFGTSDAIFSGD